MFQVIEPCVGYLHIGTYGLCKEKPYRSFKFPTTIISDTTVKRQVTHISNKQTRACFGFTCICNISQTPVIYKTDRVRFAGVTLRRVPLTTGQDKNY